MFIRTKINQRNPFNIFRTYIYINIYAISLISYVYYVTASCTTEDKLCTPTHISKANETSLHGANGNRIKNGTNMAPANRIDINSTPRKENSTCMTTLILPIRSEDTSSTLSNEYCYHLENQSTTLE